jgi:hypothetical protein
MPAMQTTSAALPLPSARARTAVEWTFLLAGLALLFALPHGILGDGLERYRSLTMLVESGTLSDTPYSMVGPLFSLPLYYLGELVFTPEWWCARYNLIVLSFGLGATWLLLRCHLDPALVRRILLLVLFGSMFPNHLENYYGEVFTAVLVAVGLLAVQFDHPIAGWTAVVLGVVNTPASVVGLAVVTAMLCIEKKRLRFAVPLVAAAVLLMLEAWVRRGGPFVTGYEGNRGAVTALPYSGRPGFSYPFFFGLISILFSFGKGLFLFVPGLLLGIRRELRNLGDRVWGAQRLWLGMVLGLVLIYAKWWSWYGGWFWGPRFFLVAAFPAAVAIGVQLAAREQPSPAFNLATLAALAWSIWVGVEGAALGNASLGETCVAHDYALESLCWYLPEFSPLFRPFVLVGKELSGTEVAALVYGLVLFGYLGAPLIGRAARDAARLVRDVTARLDVRSWRM